MQPPLPGAVSILAPVDQGLIGYDRVTLLWRTESPQVTGYTFALAVDSTNGDIVMTGEFSGTVAFGNLPSLCAPTTPSHNPHGAGFVVRFDAAGEPLWSKSFTEYGTLGSPNPQAVVVDASGSVLLATTNSHPIDFGSGPLVGGNADGFESMFMATIDASGRLVWSQSSSVRGIATGAAATPDGYVIVGAYAGSEFSLGGEPAAGASLDLMDTFVLTLHR